MRCDRRHSEPKRAAIEMPTGNTPCRRFDSGTPRTGQLLTFWTGQAPRKFHRAPEVNRHIRNVVVPRRRSVRPSRIGSRRGHMANRPGECPICASKPPLVALRRGMPPRLRGKPSPCGEHAASSKRAGPGLGRPAIRSNHLIGGCFREFFVQMELNWPGNCH